MSNQTNSISLVAECLDYTLHSLISGKFSSVEELIWSMVVDGKCCTLTSRYCDFFLLISKIVHVDNLKAFSLPDLFLSIDALESKYKPAASEDAWLNAKHDILFQMYLCELREAVGLPDDSMLPASLEEFYIPDAVPVARYRSKVALLMEKYKGYYMQNGQDADLLHPVFHQQKDALLYRVVHQSDHINDIQVPVLNRDKVLEMLKAHSMNAFMEKMIEFIRTIEKMALPTPKGFLPAAPHVSPASSELSAMRVTHVRDQSDIGSGSDILNSDDESLEDDDADEVAAGYNTDQDPLGAMKALGAMKKAPGEDSQAGGKDNDNAVKRSTTELSMGFAQNATSAEKAQGVGSVSMTEADAAAAAARAQYRAEAQRKDILERQQIKFAKLFVEALTQPPPAGTDPGFDEYWQGEGWFKGIHYTRSWYYDEDMCKIGLIETDDKMGMLYDEIGMWQTRNVWDD
eukprot:gene16172-18459_t